MERRVARSRYPRSPRNGIERRILAPDYRGAHYRNTLLSSFERAVVTQRRRRRFVSPKFSDSDYARLVTPLCMRASGNALSAACAPFSCSSEAHTMPLYQIWPGRACGNRFVVGPNIQRGRSPALGCAVPLSETSVSQLL